jgi:hypothetical protein
VLAGAPRLIAIWPAVLPLPYSFVFAEPAVSHVHFFVSLLGLTPVPSDWAEELVQPFHLPACCDVEADDCVEALVPLLTLLLLPLLFELFPLPSFEGWLAVAAA